jgi:hypothetical protein
MDVAEQSLRFQETLVRSTLAQNSSGVKIIRAPETTHASPWLEAMVELPLTQITRISTMFDVMDQNVHRRFSFVNKVGSPTSLCRSGTASPGYDCSICHRSMMEPRNIPSRCTSSIEHRNSVLFLMSEVLKLPQSGYESIAKHSLSGQIWQAL